MVHYAVTSDSFLSHKRTTLVHQDLLMGVFLVWYNYGMPDYVPQVDNGLIKRVILIDQYGVEAYLITDSKGEY